MFPLGLVLAKWYVEKGIRDAAFMAQIHAKYDSSEAILQRKLHMKQQCYAKCSMCFKISTVLRFRGI